MQSVHHCNKRKLFFSVWEVSVHDKWAPLLLDLQQDGMAVWQGAHARAESFISGQPEAKKKEAVGGPTHPPPICPVIQDPC